MSTNSIVILGEGMTLSDRCINIIKQEYSGTHFIRLRNTEDIESVGMHKPVSFALIEQEMVADDIARAVNALEPLAPKRTILAYRDDEIAAQFYRHVRSQKKLTDFGFLPMNLQLDCWLSMLRLLFLDQGCVPNALLAMSSPLAQGQDDTRSQRLDANLTPRENEILRLVARGKQNKLIAADLAVSEHTVKLHMHNIMQKLGVTNRTEAAGIYLKETGVGA